jgi:murein DD-endopeptidase MepM/ murein hydrolase activator NlpD
MISQSFGMVSKIVNLKPGSATKLIALIVLFVMVLPASIALSAPTNNEVDQITDSITEKKLESDSVKNDIGDLESDLDSIVAEYQKAYSKLQELDDAVAKKQRELNSLVEQQIYYQKILDQLNIFTYRDGDTYFLEVVLGTRSFKDLLVRFNYLVKLNQRQADIIKSTKRLKCAVEEKRDKLAAEKARQQEMVLDLQKKQAGIDQLLLKKQQLINSLGQDITKLQEEKKHNEALIASRAAQQAQTSKVTNLQINITFPIPGAYASSFINDWGFPRAGNPAGHQGCDIFALKGTPVIAVADGVISDEFGNSRVGGYRLHIIDDNGVNYYYAHLNNDSPGTDDGLGGEGTAFANGVAPGVRVTAGQLIGFVGDSGDAETTPPHLHFGIMVNDHWIPPYQYLKAGSYR